MVGSCEATMVELTLLPDILWKCTHRCTFPGAPLVFFHPFCYLRPSFFSLPPINSRITQIRGHVAGSFSHPPHYGSRLAFFIARFQLVLPSPTRLELCLPTLLRHSQQLIPFFFVASKLKKSHHARRDSNSRTKTSSINSRGFRRGSHETQNNGIPGLLEYGVA